MSDEFEDTVTVKFPLKLLRVCAPGQQIIEKKRVVNGITWWIQYYPCGQTENEKENISVFFHITGGPAIMTRYCGIHIDGILIQKVSTKDYEESGSWGIGKWLTHDQCRAADEKDGYVEFVFNVKFTRPKILPKKVSGSEHSSVKDSLKFEILEYQLDNNAVSEFDSTVKQAVKGSDKHSWRLFYFPAGDSSRSKDHISLFVEASTTEKKTVILHGAIKIGDITKHGRVFEKHFKMIVEADSECAFPKLISHKELRQIGGVVDEKVSITVEGTFTTYDNLELD
uniref:MATH domain-containing protein n=1 Tax=Panagrellus redivivus TaxID=6233 RepID=A0A7E4ZXG3_PANRE